MLNDLRVLPPFTYFEQLIVRMLKLAPTQLHPNGWAFIKDFEMVMGVFK